MKLAIMQPYFFPYLGYFQLINVADIFVVLDDVQFIKGGWINKNRILLNDNSFNIGIPVKKDSARKNINERYFVEDYDRVKVKVLRQIENAYYKAPCFEEIFSFVKRLLSFDERNVSKFNIWLLSEICERLSITTPFYISSEIKKKDDFSGEDRVIDMNQVMGSSIYINPPGGVGLYHRENFLKNGIELKFLITEAYCYPQIENTFVPDLSIIDILMFNSTESVKELLNKYHLD